MICDRFANDRINPRIPKGAGNRRHRQEYAGGGKHDCRSTCALPSAPQREAQQASRIEQKCDRPELLESSTQ